MLLESVLEAQLQKINRIQYKGGEYDFSQSSIQAGINALNDQQVAGVLMKVGNLPLIWTVIAVIWFRWYRDEQRSSRVIHRDPVTGAPLRAPVDRSSV